MSADMALVATSPCPGDRHRRWTCPTIGHGWLPPRATQPTRRPGPWRGHQWAAARRAPHRLAGQAVAAGHHQGSVDATHLQSYLDEFVFRFNRRRSRSRGMLFYRVLELAVAHTPVRYRDLIGPSISSATAVTSAWGHPQMRVSAKVRGARAVCPHPVADKPAPRRREFSLPDRPGPRRHASPWVLK